MEFLGDLLRCSGLGCGGRISLSQLGALGPLGHGEQVDGDSCVEHTPYIEVWAELVSSGLAGLGLSGLSGWVRKSMPRPLVWTVSGIQRILSLVMRFLLRSRCERVVYCV